METFSALPKSWPNRLTQLTVPVLSNKAASCSGALTSPPGGEMGGGVPHLRSPEQLSLFTTAAAALK